MQVIFKSGVAVEHPGQSPAGSRVSSLHTTLEGPGKDSFWERIEAKKEIGTASSSDEQVRTGSGRAQGIKGGAPR